MRYALAKIAAFSDELSALAATAQHELDPEALLERAEKLRSVRALQPILSTEPIKQRTSVLRQLYRQATRKNGKQP